MKVPLSWLREFVDIPETADELRATLDDLGLVVEGIEHIGEGLGDVVVARIDEVHAIDGADRVRLVVVDAGAGPLEIVCGATNFSVGDHVPLAPIGAVLLALGLALLWLALWGAAGHWGGRMVFRDPPLEATLP